MKRREFIAGLGATVVVGPRAAHGQARVRRVAVLIAVPEDDSEGQLRIQAFRQGLEKTGWIEGRNVQIDIRWATDVERMRNAARELISKQPDIVFAGATAAYLAVRQETTTLPTVFVQVADPVARGYVASLARPGGNSTGFAMHEYGIATKYPELLREIAPDTQHIGVIYNPANDGQTFLPDMEKALAPGVQLAPYPVNGRAELEQAIDQVGSKPKGALVVLSGPQTARHRDVVILLAAKYRLPLVHPYRYYAAAGGLMSYGPDTYDQYRRVAGYVDRILKGENPADLPIQFPTEYRLIINLKTARTIGLTVPPTLLARADEVIE